jgi:carbamoyl-phosphate synthase small subunit
VSRKAASLQAKSSRRRCAVLVRAEAAAPWKVKDTRLVLEDGTILRGSGFGASGTAVAEVVFNTSLTGYQEIMTDPSYKGQFVSFTHPHIGNTGINFGELLS